MWLCYMFCTCKRMWLYCVFFQDVVNSGSIIQPLLLLHQFLLIINMLCYDLVASHFILYIVILTLPKILVQISDLFKTVCVSIYLELYF